jgi:prevent-host-death family protein
MASDEYSAYEAKARFSELLRKVREGKRVTITYHGEPVAEIGPIHAEGVESRVRALRSSGRISGDGDLRGKLVPIAKRPGALERFLSERESEP